MILDLRSFILGLVISYLFIIVTEIFIFGLCIAAGRQNSEMESPETDIDVLEAEARKKIRVINNES